MLIVAGLSAFAYLIVGRYGTPFVVSQRIGLGALVFLLGRFAIVAVHETAHGLAMASFGRRIERAGVKLVVIFPYAFVDTSEAWFEPRKRRIAISAAGPVSDFALGAIFSICCVFVEGTVRDVCFQLAFAGYVGAFFNLNPFIDRDGYHMLVDYLREPGLRRRAKDQFSRRLTGEARTTDSPVWRATRLPGSAGRYWLQASRSSCHSAMSPSCPPSLLVRGVDRARHDVARALHPRVRASASRSSSAAAGRRRRPEARDGHL